MSERRPRRAAVTGIGVVAPNGTSTETFWKSTREGISVLDRVTREGCEHLPLRVAGEVRNFDPPSAVEERYLVQTDRFTHFAMAAADQALDDARLDRPETDAAPFSVGVVTAAGSGGGEFGQRELQQLWSKGSRFVGPYQSIAWFYAATTGQISIRRGFKGPCGVIASDEAGGLDALAHAARAVRRGTDVMVAGATEAPLAPYSVVCQLGYEELSTVADPDRAYRPFTAAACGFVPAEGGAMLVVEAEAEARERGAPVRALLAGHGATFTGASRWEESRAGLAEAIRVALDEAGCAPEEIDVVFADALGVPAADRAEALAIADALGAHGTRVPVTAPKTAIGRGNGAAAVLDVAAAVLAMEHGVIPPTPNVFDVCHDLDLVTVGARAAEPRTALVLSRGLMGSNSALVLRLGTGDPS
ncbi:beta-ketoacyl synthase N-terminal-like domain-containing protein [Streptomyces europaeiscabiei]|uniref:beta-ketoacyl synthase N-terminal-like domain-containing protein n=1 Tax=Streptomyces europaeiscabiei TaxID=146819 RepID=UPI0029B5FDB4|nr:beta-ketoacyl synthase N-terminal-like domain-containing protein [Streptomyces europaeiscabiei]MDX3616277.1 beta-ketoacyl synthase N-terminal-like domain-containing protein [Streptomyces europaeiscabiei]MDX3636416.1 beta-ketoacyl synthase N-terminal-like domain-containing protein [Streptomyces europaeiscabiei]MDX3654489.1 beta-ketoacyl synthase N-terminal-like domain-containing protein [Streptomyces europaeiscabiei]